MLNALMNCFACMLHALFVRILLNDYNQWIFHDPSGHAIIFSLQILYRDKKLLQTVFYFSSLV